MKTENTVVSQINIGDPAPKFIVDFVRMNPNIKSLFFAIYSPLPGVDERLGDVHEKSAAELVSDCLLHDNYNNKHWQVSTTDLTSEAIIKQAEELPSHLALGLESRCIDQDAAKKQIPMMDFSLERSPSNLDLLKDFFERLAYKGILVDSGNSYHFYGFQPLEQAAWVEFMGQCLLIPWSDTRWIGHSLIAGTGNLRISATKLKPTVPTVCELVI